MGKERFLKELGLSLEVAEPGKAKSKVTRDDSESEDKQPSPSAEEKGNVLEVELEAPQLTEESAEHSAEQPPAKEPATELGGRNIETEDRQATPAQIGEIEAEAVEGTGQEGGAEGNLRESTVDEAVPDSALFLGKKVADEIEPGRSTLAAATILPLLGTKKAWVWIVVLVCVAIAGYFFLRWYFRRGESTSLPKQEPQTVEKFMKDF